QRILELKKNTESLIDPSAILTNSTIIEPCYIGAGAKIENSVVGPHVSIEASTEIADSRISNCMIQKHTIVKNAQLQNFMLDNHVIYTKPTHYLSLGDYTTQE